MTTIYIKDDGSKLIYDRTKDGIIYGHVINAEGKSFPSQPAEQILARGYWEPVSEKGLGLPIIDTVSGKASGPSAIIEWIED